MRHLDLSRCDFREAQLGGMDLRGRNFSYSLFEKAHCEGTRFNGSDFRGAEVSFMKAANSILDECRLENLHFGYVDLSGASLQKVAASGARFQHAKLTGANLKGAVVRDGSIDADTTLDGAILDESTNFDGLKVLRPTSRHPLFTSYRFENGTLHRDKGVDAFFAPDNELLAENLEKSEDQEVLVAKQHVQHLLRNPVVTRLTAQQFANQIEDILRDVPASRDNKLVEPLQTMLEFAAVLSDLASTNQPPTEPLNREQLQNRIAKLEALVKHLTHQLEDETKARKAADVLMENDGFMANFRKSAGKTSGVAAVSVVTALAYVGVPAAAIHFLGSEHPIVTTFLSTIGRLPR